MPPSNSNNTQQLKSLTNRDAVNFGRPLEGWRLKLYTVIFEADTRAGRWFDLTLIALIITSVTVVVLDSIESIHQQYANLLTVIEWGFTLIFTVEYIARLLCVRHPLNYAKSTFGIIDILSILPTYLALLIPGLHVLIDVRILRILRLLRLLRVFRVLKLALYVAEFAALTRALSASRRKIFVFLSFVMLVVLIMGSLMYVVEGKENGFTSIPVSVYWAITTMTTVGFGDITPKTDLGRFITSVMMLIGWGTLAVPTGIVSAELTSQKLMHTTTTTTRTCHECLSEGHQANANFCRDCGAKLPEYLHDPKIAD